MRNMPGGFGSNPANLLDEPEDLSGDDGALGVSEVCAAAFEKAAKRKSPVTNVRPGIFNCLYHENNWA